MSNYFFLHCQIEWKRLNPKYLESVRQRHARSRYRLLCADTLSLVADYPVLVLMFNVRSRRK